MCLYRSFRPDSIALPSSVRKIGCPKATTINCLGGSGLGLESSSICLKDDPYFYLSETFYKKKYLLKCLFESYKKIKIS